MSDIQNQQELSMEDMEQVNGGMCFAGLLRNEAQKEIVRLREEKEGRVMEQTANIMKTISAEGMQVGLIAKQVQEQIHAGRRC